MAKPTIVTRATKGSALTWTEGDANITNLKDATIAIKAGSAGTSVVSDLNGEITFVAGTNITLTGDNTAKTVTIAASGGGSTANFTFTTNTITSTGAISLVPDSAANVVIDGLTWPATDGTNGQVIKTNGAGDLSFTTITPGITSVSQDTGPTLGGNLNTSGYNLYTTNNANISLEPNGTGNIRLTPATGKIILGALDFPTGMGSNGQVLTTNGSSAMTWTTVSGGASNLDGLSDVVITAAASGDLLYHNGTNWVDTAASTITVGTATNATAVANTGAYNTAGTNYVPFVGANTTSNQALRTSAGLTIDPSSGVTSVWGIVSTGAFQRNSGRSSGTLGNGSGFSIGAATWADTTTAAGTVATEYISYFNTPTITHANAVTVTEAATLALADPVASTNTTFTNKYSLVAAGRIKASDFTGTIGASSASTGKFTSLEFKNPLEPIFDIGTSGGTIAPDCANGSVQKITLNSALTLNAFTNPTAGESLTLIIYGGTAYTSITSTMKFAGGIKTLTATAGCIDILTVYYDGTTYFASLGKGYA